MSEYWATICENFNTAHSLFKFPVIEEENRDDDTVIGCQLSETKNPMKVELL